MSGCCSYDIAFLLRFRYFFIIIIIIISFVGLHLLVILRSGAVNIKRRWTLIENKRARLSREMALSFICCELPRVFNFYLYIFNSLREVILHFSLFSLFFYVFLFLFNERADSVPTMLFWNRMLDLSVIQRRTF